MLPMNMVIHSPPPSAASSVSGSEAAVLKGIRVKPSAFRALRLRAHEFLSDVPLHDVWRFRLRGGGPGRTVRDVIDLFVDIESSGISPVARVLFALRTMLGRVCGWDREVPTAPARSYVNRLSAEDRARSLDEPGSKRGFWTAVYTFDREALGEVINRTVHAFLLFALEPAADGYTLYWGIYVKPVSRLTPFYMALIDPFRRLLIYPALIRRFEEAWRQKWERTE